MGMPNVHGYYKTVLLDQAKFWWTPTSDKAWAQMETSVLELGPLKDLLVVIKLVLRLAQSHYPMIDAAIRIWQHPDLAPPDGEQAKKFPVR